MSDFRQDFLADLQTQFAKLRITAERAVAQVPDECWAKALGSEDNSIAVIMKHINGNLQSRCTDFLTSDGEKPSRNRDSEFVLDARDTRSRLFQAWTAAWDLLASTVTTLVPDD